MLIALLVGVAQLAHSAQRAPAAHLPTATVYVSPKGHDSGCVRGNRSRPCATFAKACALARPGDVVSIADARYPAQVVAGCAKSSPGVTFEAQTQHGAVVTGAGLQIGSRSRHSTWLRFDGIDAETFAVIGPCKSDCGSTGGDYPIGDGHRTSHIALAHMKVTGHGGTGAYAPAYVDQTDYFTFENSDVGPVCCNADGMDIYPTVSHIVLDHIHIHDIAASCSNIAAARWPSCAADATPYTDNHIDCLQMVGGDTITIADSQFVNCDAGTFMNGINRQGYRNVTLVNNFFQGHVLDMTGGGGVEAAGTYAFSGFVHIYYNTIPDGSDFQDWAPGGDYEIVGNIFGDIPPNHGACTIEGTHGNPDVQFKVARYNMFDGGAKACGATDFNGRARLVNETDRAAGIDLHLLAQSPALGRGSAGGHPRFDIDGNLRPLRAAPDVGADQRETAAIVLGRSIGAVSIGDSEAKTASFYSEPHAATRARVRGSVVRAESYGLHRGRLTVVYDASARVVGISTSSAYYTTPGGVGPGAVAPKLTRRGTGSPTCRRLSYWRRVAGANVYLSVAGGRVREVVFRVPRYDACAQR